MSFDSKVLKSFMFDDEIKYGYEEKLLCDYLVNEGYKIYYRPQAVVYHKHRSTMKGLLRRKYLLGVSSVWYRKKQNKLFMFKRHIIFLIALFLIPFFVMSKSFLYLSFFLFLVFSFSLLQDEIIINAKSIREIIITFPFLIFIEFSHFLGSCVGLVNFRLLRK
jgi:GT2 family glycosyltransferase